MEQFQTISIKQLAIILDRSTQGIYNLRQKMKRGEAPLNSLPPAIRAGSGPRQSVRWRASSIEKWMQEQEGADMPKAVAVAIKRGRGRPRKTASPIGI